MNLQELSHLLETMRNNEVRNYVVPGLTSSLIGGAGFGSVRLFTSDRDTREWVTPHSHRFDFTCLVLEGRVENTIFRRWCEGDGQIKNRYCLGTLIPKDGGLGQYHLTRKEDEYDWWFEHTFTYHAGMSYSMKFEDIHTIKFSMGARVLFFEGPQVTANSFILEPVSGGKVVKTFETRPWMFER